MDTVTISIGLPNDEVGKLDRLAAELGTERSAFVKRALRRGAADLMFERACQAYREGAATLSRSADIAGLSLHQMIARLPSAGLELN